MRHNTIFHMPFLVRFSTGTKRYGYGCNYRLFSLLLTAFALSTTSSIRALAFQYLYGGEGVRTNTNTNANANTNFVVPKRKSEGAGVIFLSAFNTNLKMSTEISTSNDKETMEEGNRTNPDTNPLPRIDGSETVGSTRWLKLETLSYTDIEGKERKWDYATRTTKKTKSSTDAVVIIPILKRPYSSDNDTKKKGDSNDGDNSDGIDAIDDSTLDTLLVEQYRPPMGRATLEFPAGLIDDGETPEQAALRELREETGYVGEACKLPPTVSRQVCMSPGLCDETVQCVVVIVDLDNPYNDPTSGMFRATPDEGEHITVHRVGLKDGFRTLLDKGSSPMAIMGLYLFAMGLEIGKSMNSNSSK